MSEQSPPTRTSRRRLYRWRRWLVYMLVLILALVGGGYWYVADPRRAASLVEGLLENVTVASVNIEAAHFSLDGTIRLRQVELHLPGRRNETGRLFKTEQVVIEHNIWSLLRGMFAPRVINFKSVPVIYLTEDLASGKFNFQLLQEEKLLQQRRPLPTHLPKVLLPEGRVQFGQVEGDRYTQLNSTLIQGRLLADRSRPSRYRFELVQKNPGTVPGAVLTGTCDPQYQTFNAEIDGFTLAGPHRNWLPRDWRRWWDQHKPTGTIQKLRLGYHHGAQEFFAEIRVEDVSVIPPYPAVEQAGIRMTGGSGTFMFYKDRIEIKDLRGQMEGISCEINGKILGYQDQAVMRLENHFEVTIPDRFQYLEVMPAPVVTLFRRLKPAGRFSVSVLLERRNNGARLIASGTVKIQDAEAQFEYFPYPLSHLQGEVHFDPEKVRIVALSGQGPNGESLRIDGRIWPPGPNAGLDLYVAGQDVMLDDNLYKAIRNPHRLKAIRTLLDSRAHAKLIASGLIQTTVQHAAIGQRLNGALARLAEATAADRTGLEIRITELRRLFARPVFDLGGTVNFKSHIERKPGAGTDPQVTTAVNVSGVNLLYSHWPYPLQIDRGMLVVTPGAVAVQEIESHGLTADSRILANGQIRIRDGKVNPELELESTNVPMDGLLLASMQSARRRWLNNLGIRGRIDAHCRVFSDDHGEIDFLITTRLKEGAARPFKGRYELEVLTGQATMSRNRVKFDKLEGRHGDSQMTFNGDASWSEKGWACTLEVEGSDLRFEDDLLDLLPSTLPSAERLRKYVEDTRPKGLFDTTLGLYMTDKRPVAYQLELRPVSINFDLSDRRIALSKMAGRVIATPEKIVIDNAEATFEGGCYAADGIVTLGVDPTLDLKVSVTQARFGRGEQTIFPKTVKRVLDHLQLDGGYGIPKAQIIYRPKARDNLLLEFKGLVRLADVSLRVGVPISRLSADMHIEVTCKADQKWPRLDLILDAGHVRVEDRLISPLALTISNSLQRQVLKIDKIRGRCYGGIVMGSGQVELEEEGEYEMDLIVQDAGLAPLIEPPGPETSLPGPTVEKLRARGLFSGTLAFRARRDNPQTIQGRGEIQVHQANLYETPLSLALLQLVNLTIPSAKAFDHASAHFILDGDRVLFDDIVFDAPRVRVAGQGTMDYSTRKLDLDLVTSNPTALDLGPLSDLVSVLKNELLSIYVGGTLMKPDAKVTRFQGIGQLLRRRKHFARLNHETPISNGYRPVDPQETSVMAGPMIFGQ